jgi:hypothetical protein
MMAMDEDQVMMMTRTITSMAQIMTMENEWVMAQDFQKVQQMEFQIPATQITE